MRTTLTTLILLTAATTFAAEPDPKLPAIVALKNLPTTPAVFDDAKLLKPIELKTANDAATYFKSEGLKALEEQVDFNQQIVLVFAWRGSGADKLTYEVASPFRSRSCSTSAGPHEGSPRPRLRPAVQRGVERPVGADCGHQHMRERANRD